MPTTPDTDWSLDDENVDRHARDVLAMADHTCPDPAFCGYDLLRDHFNTELARLLPGQNPATVGRIVIATGAAIASGMRLLGLNIDSGNGDNSSLAGTAVTVMGVTGAQMYLDATDKTT